MKLVLFNDHRPVEPKGDKVVDISDQIDAGRTGQRAKVHIVENWDPLNQRIAPMSCRARRRASRWTPSSASAAPRSKSRARTDGMATDLVLTFVS